MTEDALHVRADPRRSPLLRPQPRGARLGRARLRGALRRRARAWLPGPRARVAAAVDWATAAVAELPDHTHAARLVGLVPPPPAGLPAYAGTRVWRALEDSGATCLQRCLVLQAWMTAHGEPCEVAVGFRTDGGFRAHAWIPGFHGADESEGFQEIARVPAPVAGQGALRAAAPTP